ncbi:MAG: hypothetical protein OEY77_03740 [Nitrospira sp.]|nr:hypothetical protein [Nitrospira sp.]
MDRYTTDLKGTGLLFLSLKPRLLKCTISATEKRTEQKNDLLAEVAPLSNSATTRTG